MPLLLSPSPASPLHAAHALTTLFQGPRAGGGQGQQQQTPPYVEAPAHVQYRALVYAVRWEIGIDKRDFLSNALDGEQWLVHASGSVRPLFVIIIIIIQNSMCCDVVCFVWY